MSLAPPEHRRALDVLNRPGLVRDRLLLLGSSQFQCYLVMGEVYALVGGSTSWDLPTVEEQLDRFGVDRSLIRHLVLSHSHFDHCGAVPYFNRRYPHMKVAASPYAAEILAKEKPVRLFAEMNAKTMRKKGIEPLFRGTSLEFEAIGVEEVLNDGDLLDLGGGVTLEAISTPGHSRCSLSIYVPALKTLFPGDAIPFPDNGRDGLVITANHDFADYLRSLRKLQRLDVELIALEHIGVVGGETARALLGRGLEATLRQREKIRSRHAELADEEVLVGEITGKYRRLPLFAMVPDEVLDAIVRKMIRSALEDA